MTRRLSHLVKNCPQLKSHIPCPVSRSEPVLSLEIHVLKRLEFPARILHNFLHGYSDPIHSSQQLKRVHFTIYKLYYNKNRKFRVCPTPTTILLKILEWLHINLVSCILYIHFTLLADLVRFFPFCSSVTLALRVAWPPWWGLCTC